MLKDLNYLIISDIHLGNKRNTAIEIIKNLDIFFDYFKSTSQFSNLDIIFIAGDIFDGLLDFADNDIHEITLWLSRLIHFCSRFKIKLRILEGTPSHDWKQSKIAETLCAFMNVDIDFKYIDTLHIEYIKDINLSVLYVPDEWTASSDLTFSQVKDLMADMNIDQVDIAIMHGMFPHQCVNAPSTVQKHDPANYLPIVKYFIHIGHIHSYSVFERIIAQGSFDRLAHGEEEAKGAVLVSLAKDGQNHFSFIENKGAKIFKTITLKFKDIDRSLAQIDKVVSKLPINSYVRIKAAKDHPVYIAFDDLKLKYPLDYFTKSSLEDDTDTYTLIDNGLVSNDDYCAISITKDNVVSLIMTEVRSKYSLNEKTLTLMNSILESAHAG